MWTLPGLAPRQLVRPCRCRSPCSSGAPAGASCAIAGATPGDSRRRSRRFPKRRCEIASRPKPARPDRRFRRPGIVDWAVLTIGVLFVALGLFLLPHEPDVAIVTLAFFGSCALVAAHTVLRKRADSRADLRWAGLVGGVPIRPSRTGAFLLASWITVLGITLLIFGGTYPPAFRAISWLLAAIGALLLLAWLLGWVPAGYLQFDPNGITIAGRRSSYRVPW